MCQIEYIIKECILCFSVLFPPPPTTLSAAAGFPPPPSGLPRLTPPIGPPAVNGHAVKEPPRWSDWEIQKVIKDQDWLYMDQVSSDLVMKKTEMKKQDQQTQENLSRTWYPRNLWRKKRVTDLLSKPPSHPLNLSCGNHEQLYQPTPINLGDRQAFTYSLKDRRASSRQIEAITTIIMIMQYLKSKCNIHTYHDIYKQGKERKKESKNPPKRKGL